MGSQIKCTIMLNNLQFISHELYTHTHTLFIGWVVNFQYEWNQKVKIENPFGHYDNKCASFFIILLFIWKSSCRKSYDLCAIFHAKMSCPCYSLVFIFTFMLYNLSWYSGCWSDRLKPLPHGFSNLNIEAKPIWI